MVMAVYFLYRWQSGARFMSTDLTCSDGETSKATAAVFIPLVK